MIKVGNSYRIAYEGLMEWLKAQKVNNTPEGATKKEIKMSFLKDVFQTADEIKQSQEKLKDAVDASSRQAAALVRPYLSEVQNEILSEILERLVASVAEHSFQIGYSSAMQTFAEAAAALEARSHAQQ